MNLLLAFMADPRLGAFMADEEPLLAVVGLLAVPMPVVGLLRPVALLAGASAVSLGEALAALAGFSPDCGNLLRGVLYSECLVLFKEEVGVASAGAGLATCECRGPVPNGVVFGFCAAACPWRLATVSLSASIVCFYYSNFSSRSATLALTSFLIMSSMSCL